MGLGEYKRKRHFTKTPEPRGRRAAGARSALGGKLYVIHEHHARRLHFDLRLEMEGTLKSWAVPKGPSLDPNEKRLAVHVEDHPLEYASFHGTIPKGEYGAGEVIIWDEGRWFPIGDASSDYRKGRLKFRLEGKRLHGVFNLVRMNGASGDDGKNWLLIKDRHDDAGETPAAGKEAALPETVRLQLATSVTEPPLGDDWLHEIKYDGYRVYCRIAGGRASVRTRESRDWTDRFHEVAAAAARLPLKDAILDGEVVVLRPDGISSFQELQNSLTAGRTKNLTYFVFDLLHLDGRDLTGLPLEERKEQLAALLKEAGPSKTIRYSDHQVGKGAEMYAEACRRQLEGIVSKRKDGRYVAGRGRDWLKVKCLSRQEFVIGGYSEPTGARQGFGALLVGVYEKGKLIYCGRVGTGFTERSLAELHGKLGRLERKDTPFAAPPAGRDRHGVHWVEPELVAEVTFTEWTSEGILRQPVFQGLREDKDPKKVVRERASSVEKATAGEAEADPPETSATTNPVSRSVNASRVVMPSSPKNPPGRVTVGGISLSNPEKVLYPQDGITKEDVARYYESIAEHVLPHVVDRPLMIVRCPEGWQKECFYQKHLNMTMPKSIKGVKVKEEKGERTYIRIDSLEGLIGLVQMGVLEIHAWGASANRIERPDRMIFDLDPDTKTSWEEVVRTARLMRDRLSKLGMESFLKTTGGKGLHVVVPLAGRNDWTEVKEFSRAVAESLVREAPDRYTSKMSLARRHGKIFIDYLRNARGATAVAAFSTRARQGAPVSAPIGWQELKPSLTSDAFTLKNLPARLSRLRSDPWDGYESARVAITRAMRKGL